MEDGNLAILVDAKTEYTKQLVNIVSPNIYLGIKKIYMDSKTMCNNNNDDDILFQFQNDLSEIPKWNQEIINNECELLINNSNCDWLDDLLTAVFVSHTRILTSINFNKNKNKINLKIPKVDHFIHLCYIEIARHFWKNPYLFDDTISKFEYQRNRRDAEKIIDTTINETIRKQLPVKHILKEYLGNEFKDTKLEDESVSESTENENLRKMVKAEIENCSKEKLKKLNINSEENIDVMEDDSLLELHDYSSKKEEPKKENNPPKEIDVEETKEEPKKENKTPKDIDVEETKEEPKKENKTPKEIDVEETKEEPKKENKTPKDIDVEETKEDPKKENKTPKEIDVEETKEEPKKEKKEIVKEVNNEIKTDKMQHIDKDINELIDNEINSLKIETLNLNFDDLDNLEEIYIDEPVSELKNNDLENIDMNKNTVKTVYIETNEETPDKKKHSKNDFNFFE
jgi:hypothetical protein